MASGPNDRVPLNRLAYGLLDFFGIKNQGRYTQHLLEDLQPVLELDRLYKASAEQFQREQVANVPVGSEGLWVSPSVVGMIVPNDRIWHVHEYSVTITSPASGGDAITFGYGATRQEMGSYLTYGSPIEGMSWGTMTLGTSQRIGVARDWSGQGRFFGPNTRFGCVANVFVAVVDITFQIRYTPLAF